MATPAPATPPAEGIDISAYQDFIEWDKLPNALFCYCKATEGLTYEDKQFDDNWIYSNKPRGAYHFLRPRVDCKLQAEKFLGVAGRGRRPLSAGDLIPAVDIEETSGNPARDEWRELQSAERVRAILEYSDVIKAALGVLPLLYIRPNWIAANIDPKHVTELYDFPLWIPYYGPELSLQLNVTPQWRNQCKLWQYTSKGRVPGISGDVDLDRAMVPLAEITLK